MKRYLLPLLVVSSGCTAPALDDVLWSCTSVADCPSGFVCSTQRGACVEPDNSEPGVDSTSITVGMTGPITTGPAGLGTAVKQGIEAYFAFINSQGGVDGRQLQLTALDDGDDPSRAAANLQTLKNSGEVFAYVGAVGSNTASTLVDFANTERRILFGPVSGSPVLRKDPPDRYVFNVRASTAREIERAVGYMTAVRVPAIPAANVAVLAEASDASGATLSAFGQEGADAVTAELRRTANIMAADVQVSSYAAGTVDVTEGVGSMLKWLGSGLATGDDGTVRATVFMSAHARPAAAFAKALLDELFQIKRGTSPGLEFDLTTLEVAELLNVSDVLFVAVSASGPDELATELAQYGTYQTLAGDRPYCENVVTTQVVPDINANASGLIEYRDQLRAFDPNIEPSFIGLEGYAAARLFTRGLLEQGPGLRTEDLITTFEGLGEVDLGIGTTYEFSGSDRQASDRVWATVLNPACVAEPFDLGDPGNVIPPPPDPECPGNVCILTGTLTTNQTLTADKRWLLRGTVFVGNGTDETTLTIEPGTTVLGEVSTTGVLVIKRNSRLVADGTREAPIVFTSSSDPGSRVSGDWGGVIINGNAPINGCTEAPCEAFGEGGTGFYGGSDPTDDSGILRYVRIEFGGKLLSPENELNGLALQGVGNGTVLDYIQIHLGQDDGIEFFGGTVDFKHILVTGADDDNLDWTQGWVGRGQFFVCQQNDTVGDNGIEADNAGDPLRDALPRSMPVLSNLTLIGSPASDSSDYGMLIREGTGAQISNALVVGWNDACLDIDHIETWNNAVTGSTLTDGLLISNSIFDCATATEEEAEDPITVRAFLETNSGNSFESVMLADPFNLVSPDFKPMGASPANQGAVVPADAFFEQVSFRGGVDPANDWTIGWTTNAPN